jgi:hypothetical protein
VSSMGAMITIAMIRSRDIQEEASAVAVMPHGTAARTPLSDSGMCVPAAAAKDAVPGSARPRARLVAER